MIQFQGSLYESRLALSPRCASAPVIFPALSIVLAAFLGRGA